ncbi:MAG: EAL domain-containing protein [Alphaproteobacteria bacterium]
MLSNSTNDATAPRQHDATADGSRPQTLESLFHAGDQTFREIFDAVNDGIFISDPGTGRFVEINEPGCRMFGYEKADLLGRDVDTLSSGIHPHTTDMAIELNERARQGLPQIFEWQCRAKDGSLFWTEISLRYAVFGQTPAIVAIIRDIAERKRLDAQIVYLAQHDILTGLANRSMFATALDRAIAQSLRSGRPFAVLCLDLDRFKDVNDMRGHLAGDRLLRLVAERLKADIRQNENVARFGGDEFAILLEDLHEPAEIAAMANRLIASICKPCMIDGNEISVGASIGVAIYGDDSRDAETLLAHADIALYRAKAEGRQTFRFYSEAMNAEVRARVAMSNALRSAISSDQLFLVYQPQVTANGGHITGVEALVRWRHPELGVLTPDQFLPVAESNGLITTIDHWVLREACRQSRYWNDSGIGAGTISVNLSPAHFKPSPDFERMVLTTLAETGLAAHFLELEITEVALIALPSEHRDMLLRLRRAGVRISLDDFGASHSSLSFLSRFGVDRIKISQDFIAQLATSAESAIIVKTILGLSRDLGNDAIAKGVETGEQLQLLQSFSCPDVQGFYFSAPLSAEAITPFLSAGKVAPAAMADAHAA